MCPSGFPQSLPLQNGGHSPIYCVGLSAYKTSMPFNLGLVSHGACALGLPKGRIQFRVDLAQNRAETGLYGLWDLGKGTPLPAYFETLPPQWKTERKTQRPPSLIQKRTQLSGSLCH